MRAGEGLLAEYKATQASCHFMPGFDAMLSYSAQVTGAPGRDCGRHCLRPAHHTKTTPAPKHLHTACLGLIVPHTLLSRPMSCWADFSLGGRGSEDRSSHGLQQSKQGVALVAACAAFDVPGRAARQRT